MILRLSSVTVIAESNPPVCSMTVVLCVKVVVVAAPKRGTTTALPCVLTSELISVANARIGVSISTSCCKAVCAKIVSLNTVAILVS